MNAPTDRTGEEPRGRSGLDRRLVILMGARLGLSLLSLGLVLALDAATGSVNVPARRGLYGTVAFAATSPSSTDACSPNGTSRVYAIDLGTGYCALTGGGSSCYVTNSDGVVIDLTFYSVNSNGVGKSRLIAGSNSATDPNVAPVHVVGTRSPANLGLHRLNWREIVINN